MVAVIDFVDYNTKIEFSKKNVFKSQHIGTPFVYFERILRKYSPFICKSNNYLHIKVYKVLFIYSNTAQ